MWNELLARPGEPLIEHLQGVAALAARSAPPQLAETARLAGLTHDLFKATPWFQDYLRANKVQKPKLKAKLGPKLHHALPSALFAAFVAERDGGPVIPLFLAVARHHGHLRTPSAILPDPFDPDMLYAPPSRKPWAIIAEQTQALLASQKARGLFETLGLLKHLEDFAEEGPETVATRLRNIPFRGPEDYWQTLTLFSLLIDADKHLAARVRPQPRFSLPADAAEQRVRRLNTRGTRLDPYRNRLFQEVGERARKLPLNKLFPAKLSLTAPTGSGKTLALLHFALHLRERIESTYGKRLRIVYALPLVNLIEQNYRVFEQALKEAEVPSEAILAHHHLAEFEEEGDEEVPLEERLLLVEAWEAEVIVTTFVQVVETLFGTRNRMLKKFHRLTGGTILILDEVQALPAEDWPLVQTLLDQFVGQGNTVILATATQPALLEGALELAPHLTNYPVRVRIQRAERIPEEPPKASRLIVVNTIRRSLELFRELKDRGERVYYLSTNLTPRDRELRIQELKKLLPHTSLTLVATPIVEAGLDLDFAEGWRELGPVDSVVQVAGRVNRSALREVATLHLLPDEGRAARVYGSILASLARDFFDANPSLTDREIETLLPAYFKELKNRISPGEARGYLQALEQGRFCRKGYPSACECGNHAPDRCDVCCYRLIREKVRRVPIFVEQDEEATDTLARLERALALPDPNDRRLELLRLRPQLNRFTINPTIEVAAQNLPGRLFGREDYRLIGQEELEAYYDPETGFLWQMGLSDQLL